MVTHADVRAELAGLADPARAETVSRFLRMVPGGYGEGDRAIGVPVPRQRAVAGRYWRALSLADTVELLTSGVHEERPADRHHGDVRLRQSRRLRLDLPAQRTAPA